MSAGIHIRPMLASDLDAVLSLAASLRHAPHWSRAMYEPAFDAAARPLRMALVAEDAVTKDIVGFVFASVIPPEAELESVAVAAAHQRRGIARELIAALSQDLSAKGVHEVLLEVRPSNSAARSLYEKLGFREAGRRSGYYVAPVEDALILRRAILQITES